MRVNVYAEEMTDRIEIISKEIEGQTFTGLRFYLELPVSEAAHGARVGNVKEENFTKDVRQVKGPFIHRFGDDDSAAVTFWGKKDLRKVLTQALLALDAHYGENSKNLT